MASDLVHWLETIGTYNMALPTLSVESVLIEEGASVPPPRHIDSIVGRQLGDIALGALINAAASDGCIQTSTPEEVPIYGNDADNYF